MTDSDNDSGELQKELDPDDRSATQRADGTSLADEATSTNTDDTRQTGSETTPPESDAERIADELGRTDLRTTEEGYVEAEVTNLQERDDDTIELTVQLPSGEEPTFALEKPLPWSDSFLFARIVEDAGYDAASIEHIVGETVYLERVDHPESGPSLSGERQPVPVQILDTLFGLSAGAQSGPSREWRLVDPDEHSVETTEGRSATERLVLATLATAVSFVGIVLGSLFAVTALELSGFVVLLGAVVLTLLLGLGYVGYTALVLLDRFAS
jgi:hypothetical protein